MEEFNDNRCLKAFKSCGHAFCQDCLQRTLQIKPFCPLCRQYQNQNNSDYEGPTQLEPSTLWNPDVVRAYYSEETVDENGQRMRNVRLSNGEATNIHVSPNVKIHITPSTNIRINGKRVQNPSDCNQQ